MAKLKSFLFIVLLFLIVSCGNTNDGFDSESNSMYQLSGTWFYELENNAGNLEYSGEHIIKDSNKSVSIISCDRSTVNLLEDGNNLIDESGNIYYLSIQDSETLIGPNDIGGTSKVVKRYQRTNFESGTLQFAMDGYNDLNESVDVCASARKSRYSSLANELIGTKLILSAPYGDSYITIEIDFRDITVGDYSITSDLGDFVDIVTNHIMMSIDSPVLIENKNRDRVFAVSGSVTVQSFSQNNLTISGDVLSTLGESITFIAVVKLNA